MNQDTPVTITETQARELMDHVAVGGKLCVVVRPVQTDGGFVIGPIGGLIEAMRVVSHNVPMPETPDDLLFLPEILPLIGAD